MKALPGILQEPTSLVMPLAGQADKGKDKDRAQGLAALAAGGAAGPLINTKKPVGLLSQFMGSGS